jgi:hypothetical protein
MIANPLLADLSDAAAHVISHVLQNLPEATLEHIGAVHAAGGRLELRILIGAYTSVFLIHPDGTAEDVFRLEQLP